MNATKYRYEKVLQGFFGSWEDLVASEDTDSSFRFKSAADRAAFKDDIKAYRENDPRPYRVVKRRVLREASHE